MNVAIVGLSSSGKTVLFDSFVGHEPRGGSKAPQVGIVNVPDQRLDRLSALYHPKKTTFTTVNFRDAVPLDSAAKQERIALFDMLKTVDAFVCVVGAYRWSTAGEIQAELQKLRLELIIQDLDFVMKRTERLEREMKSSQSGPQKEKEMELLKRLQPILEKEQFLVGMTWDTQERRFMADYNLLTERPACYVLNVAEDIDTSLRESVTAEIGNMLNNAGAASPVLALNAKLEAEIAAFSPGERVKFLEEFHIAESSRDRVIRSSYELLDLITFFTVGEDECRSWQIRRGATALDAAGAIHTDLARGFIRAEVIEHDILLELGSLQEARRVGKLRLEGKAYEVKDGEIVHIMFNI